MSELGNGPQATRLEAGAVSRSVCVILPALNEERTIGSVIRRIPRETLEVLGYSPRILVVDGNSIDSTLAIARARGAEIVHQDGRGKGNALRQVVEVLQGDGGSSNVVIPGPTHFVVLDADGTYAPETITDLVAALDSGYDLVLASRFLGFIHPGAMGSLNRLGNRLLTQLFRFLNGVALTDVCTGMYAFNDRVLRNLRLEADGFDVEADLFTAACLMGARIAEVPVDYSRRVGEPKLLPLRAGIRIGLRILSRWLERGNRRIPVMQAAGRPPHPFIAWTGRLRDLSSESRLAFSTVLGILGRIGAGPSGPDGNRRS